MNSEPHISDGAASAGGEECGGGEKKRDGAGGWDGDGGVDGCFIAPARHVEAVRAIEVFKEVEADPAEVKVGEHCSIRASCETYAEEALAERADLESSLKNTANPNIGVYYPPPP
jgi:hypothetical protein